MPALFAIAFGRMRTAQPGVPICNPFMLGFTPMPYSPMGRYLDAPDRFYPSNFARMYPGSSFDDAFSNYANNLPNPTHRPRMRTAANYYHAAMNRNVKNIWK